MRLLAKGCEPKRTKLQSDTMTAVAVLNEIHALPPDERQRLFDALWSEDRETWEARRREEEEDVRDALAVVNDPAAEWVPWEQVKSELHALRD